MNPRSCLLSFSLSILIIFFFVSTSKNAIANAQPVPSASSCLDPIKDKYYTAKASSLVSSLSSYISNNTTNDYQFHNSSTSGSGSHSGVVVYGLYLCRASGDVSESDCVNCVQTAAKDIIEQCSNYKTAVFWYENCMLRYSNQAKYPDTFKYMFNTQNSTDQKRFSRFVVNLLHKLATETAYTTSGKNVAVKEGNFTKADTVYSFAQCIPNISNIECDTCLRSAIRQLPLFCDGCVGARVFFPNCNIRFETYLFYVVVKPGASHTDSLSKQTPFGPTNTSVIN